MSKEFRKKGNYAEAKVDINLEESRKYLRVNEETRVKDLEMPTRRGMDSIYMSANPYPKYIIVDAKLSGNEELLWDIYKDNNVEFGESWLKKRKAKSIRELLDLDGRVIDRLERKLNQEDYSIRVLAQVIPGEGIAYYHIEEGNAIRDEDGEAMEWEP